LNALSPDFVLWGLFLHIRKALNPLWIKRFLLVGLVGLEPMTSTMSSAFPAVRRLAGNPYKITILGMLAGSEGWSEGEKMLLTLP